MTKCKNFVEHKCESGFAISAASTKVPDSHMTAPDVQESLLLHLSMEHWLTGLFEMGRTVADAALATQLV